MPILSIGKGEHGVAQYLVANVFLKVLLPRDIYAYTSILQPLCLNFVTLRWHCGYYDIRKGESLFETKVAWMDHMPGVVPLHCY